MREVLGHSREVSILKRAVSGGRLAHAYLFTGPDGVGKRFTARALARLLNCEGLDFEGEPCGVCGPCAQIYGEGYINLVEVEPVDGVIKIDQVRLLQKAMRFRVEGGTRVAIIDDAHLLKKEAANALLKTLEEPPAGSVLILISSNSSTILPTILSRCQRVTFKPLSVDILLRIIKENKGVSGDEALEAATLSTGSLSLALNFLDGDVGQRRRELFASLKSIKAGDIVGVEKLAERLAKGSDLIESLEFLKCYFRDLACRASGSDDLVAGRDILPERRDGEELKVDRYVRNYNLCEEARLSVLPPRYGNKQLAMEDLLLTLFGVG